MTDSQDTQQMLGTDRGGRDVTDRSLQYAMPVWNGRCEEMERAAQGQGKLSLYPDEGPAAQGAHSFLVPTASRPRPSDIEQSVGKTRETSRDESWCYNSAASKPANASPS